ncbi:MAG: RluA family pseudouridine synthase [Clostridia bacterium]|nr:RluA family pseudouridine synthase [Clostridia bacterium]
MEIKKIEIDVSGQRMDVYLASSLNFTRSKMKNLLDKEKCKINGKPIKPRDITKKGEIIEVEIDDPVELAVKPVEIPLDIVYQDDYIAVINKQQGLTVHQGSGTDDNTLVNALLYHLDNLSGINGVIRPGIVHRIDKDTSGLLVVAKNDEAHLSLSNQIANKTCKRTYYALLEGVLKIDEGVIDTFIDRSKKDRTKMAVADDGRRAITSYKVLKRYEKNTLCEFKLSTGRTHQIRVHAKHIGHPVVGDSVYGYKTQKFKLNGQLLHAIKLEFVHPKTNKEVCFEAPLPDYFLNVLRILDTKN